MRGPTLLLPGVADPIWCDPATLATLTVGVSGPSGILAATWSIPNSQSLRGFAFIGQAAELAATGTLAISNPSPGFVR